MNRRIFLAQAAAFASAVPASFAQFSPRKTMKGKDMSTNIPLTTIHRIQADGVNVFYRDAGPANAPLPASSH